MADQQFLTRLATESAIVSLEERTIRFSFSSTAPVERYAYWGEKVPEGTSPRFDEVLSHNREDWDLKRVRSKVAPFLANHDRNQRLGTIRKVDFEGDRGFVEVKLRRTKEADELLNDLQDGTAPGVSFGYQPRKYKVLTAAEWTIDKDGYRKLKKKSVLLGQDIELFEVSAESIPADPSVGFGRSAIDLRSIELEGDPDWESKPRSDEPPHEYVLNLKTNHSQIWALGGQQRGNAAFDLWTRHEQGDKAAAVKKWHENDRPSWIEKHNAAHAGKNLAGAIAALKWGHWGSEGEQFTRQLIEKAIEQEKKKMPQLDEEFDSAALLERVQKLEAIAEEGNKRASAAEERAAVAERQLKLTREYGELQALASQLSGDMKLSNAERNELFSGDSESIELLLKSENADMELYSIRKTLKAFEKRSPQLNKTFRVSKDIEQRDGETPATPTGESPDDYAKRLAGSLRPAGI